MIGIVNHGSIVLVGPTAEDHLPFADWLSENVGDEVTFWGDSLVVEPRYVDSIIAGLEEAGFEVQIP